MDLSLYFFVPAAIVAALLANIGIWAPRKMWVRISAVVAAAAFMPLTYGSISELLSRPKPVSLEWARRTVPEAKLLAASMQEGTAIFLWLQVPDDEEPRAYRLPWSQKMARQLQSAQRQAKKNKNGVRVRRPFEGTEDTRERMFYAPPQASLPTKQRPEETPLHYMRPQRGT